MKYKIIWPKNITTMIESFSFRYQNKISFSFLSCLNDQISADYERLTATRINPKKVGLASFDFPKMQLTYGHISSFYTFLYVNHNWPRCKICWQSHSGRIYKLEDEITDCNDVRFWLEEIDIEEIKRMLEPPKNLLPFRTNMLRFELEVQNLAVDLTVRLQMDPGIIAAAEKLIGEIDHFIDGFNQASEKQDREEGVIHNWKRRIEGDTLVFEMDMGSTDARFLEKWLKHLSKMGAFMKVTLE